MGNSPSGLFASICKAICTDRVIIVSHNCQLQLPAIHIYISREVLEMNVIRAIMASVFFRDI